MMRRPTMLLMGAASAVIGARRPRPSIAWQCASSRRAGVLAGVAFALVAIGASAACGTEVVGVEACQRVERVRCESAQACGIDLGRPTHEGNTPEKNVAACIRYYDDQCLHGIVAPKEPGPQAVDACVNAIIQGDCSVVRSPESHPDCRFLVPPAPPPAAGPDAAAEASAASG